MWRHQWNQLVDRTWLVFAMVHLDGTVASAFLKWISQCFRVSKPAFRPVTHAPQCCSCSFAPHFTRCHNRTPAPPQARILPNAVSWRITHTAIGPLVWKRIASGWLVFDGYDRCKSNINARKVMAAYRIPPWGWQTPTGWLTVCTPGSAPGPMFVVQTSTQY